MNVPPHRLLRRSWKLAATLMIALLGLLGMASSAMAVPENVDPADGAIVTTSTPGFSWNDPAPNILLGDHYAVVVDGTLTCTTVDLTTTSCIAGAAIADGLHGWQVQTVDATGLVVVEASTTTNFTIDTQAPAAFALVSPADNATVTTNTPTFVSATTTDTTALTYTLVVDGTVQPANVVVGASTVSLTPVSAFADGAHLWTVRATDGAGHSTDASPSRTVTIDTTPPNAFALQSPADGALTTDSTPSFVSATTTDATSPPVSYSLIVDGAPRTATVTVGLATVSAVPTVALTDGGHTWSIRAADGAGLSTTPVPRTITIDTTPPAAFALQTPANGTVTNFAAPPFISDTTTDASLPISYALIVDGLVRPAGVTVGATSVTAVPNANLADGSHTWTIRATDAAGLSTSPATRTIVIDTVPPVLAAPSPAAGSLIRDPSPLFTWTAATDTGGSGIAGYNVSIDGGPPTALGPAAVSFQAPVLTEGVHVWSLTAFDVAGNATTQTQSFTIDSVAPAPFVLSGPVNGAKTLDTTPTFTWAQTVDVVPGSGVVGYDFVQTAAGTATCPAAPVAGPFDVPGNPAIPSFTPAGALPDGVHSWIVCAVDAAGNVRAATAAQTVTIDTVNPTAFATTGPGNNTFVPTATPLFSWNPSSDPLSGLAGYVFRDVLGAGPATCPAEPYLGPFDVDPAAPLTFAPAALSEGVNSWVICAVDQAGNVTPTAANTVVVDLHAPTGGTLAGPAAFVNNPAISVTEPTQSIDNLSLQANLQYGLSESTVIAPAFSAGAFPRPFTLSAGDGAKAVWLWARDQAGNSAPVFALGTTLDTVAPDVPAPASPLTTATPTTTDNTNGPLTWVPSADLTSGVDHYVVQVSNLNTVTGTFNVVPPTTTLVIGTAQVPQGSPNGKWQVQAIDRAGNVSTMSALQTFTFDNAAPSVLGTTTISTTGVGLTNTPNVAVTVAGFHDNAGTPITPDALLRYSVTEIGGATTPFAAGPTLPFTLPGADGLKSLRVQAQDLAGNISALSAPATVTLDTTPPGAGTIAAPGLTPASRAVPGGVALVAPSSDQLAPPVRYALSEDAVNPPADAAFGTAAQFPFSRPFTLNPGADGPRTINLWAKDQAGNISRVDQIQTTLDSVFPSLTPATDPAPPPAPEGANFGVAGAFITLAFSKPVSPLDASSLQIVCTRADCNAPTAAMAITPSPDRKLVTLTPATPLQTGMRYQIRLVGITDDAGNGLALAPAQAGQWFFTTGTDAVPPGAVGGLTATPGVEQIVLRWSNPPDADLAKIRILRKETGPPSSPSDPAARVIDLPPNATTYTDTGLTPGKTYYYAIYAFDTSGNPSAVGAVVNQIPQAPAPLSKIPSVVPKKKPPTPKVSNARAGTPRKGAVLTTLTPTLRWKKAPGKVTLYNLQFFSIADTGALRKVLSVFPRGVSYKVPPRRLKAGVRYMWRLWPYHGSKATRSAFIVSFFDVSPKAVAPKAASKTTKPK